MKILYNTQHLRFGVFLKKYSCILFSINSGYVDLDRVCEVTNNYMQITKIFLNDRTSASIEMLKEEISSLPRPDFIFNYFAPKKFPKWLLDLPKFDAINFHTGSNQYPGVGATSFALYNGDINFGLTAHRMNEKFDNGEIINQFFFKIKNKIDCLELYNQAMMEGLNLLESTLKLLVQDTKPSKICDWLCLAKTKIEFEEWMTFEVEKDNRNFIKLFEAVYNDKYPGPYLKFSGKLFSYLKAPE